MTEIKQLKKHTFPFEAATGRLQRKNLAPVNQRYLAGFWEKSTCVTADGSSPAGHPIASDQQGGSSAVHPRACLQYGSRTTVYTQERRVVRTQGP